MSNLERESPLIPFWLMHLTDKIKQIQFTKAASYLTVILFQMIVVVPLLHLPYLLDLIDGVVKGAPKQLQLLLCKLLFKVISSSFDYQRKETCIKWYLNLVQSIGLRPNKL
jgi:hypothetical protein